MAYEHGDPMTGYWHRCPLCGTEFYARAEWVYKRGYRNHKPVYYCSYTCVTRYDREEEEKKQKRKEARKNGRAGHEDRAAAE